MVGTRMNRKIAVIEDAAMILMQNEVPEATREHAIDLAPGGRLSNPTDCEEFHIGLQPAWLA